MSVGSRSRDVLRRLARSWRWRTAVGGALLVALLLWLAPRRVDDVISLGGDERWRGAAAPPRRHVVWQPPRALTAPSPSDGNETDDAGAAQITPHLADGG